MVETDDEWIVTRTGMYVGGVVAKNYGRIINCEVDGVIEGGKYFGGHLGADETLVYHRDLKLCHESHRGNDAARRQGWKFRCG